MRNEDKSIDSHFNKAFDGYKSLGVEQEQTP